jgi:predicted transglutaminase-like cysteine proteinase
MQLAASRGALSRPAVAASLRRERTTAARLWRSPEEDPAEPPVAEPSTAAPVAADPVRIDLDQRTWDALRRINTRVNRAIRPASDQQVYGVRDWWVAPLSSGLSPYGDCKDYALEKRRELIAAGVPARTLALALADTPWGELHAVLVVDTRQGDYVLDNIDPRIRLWSRTPYLWRSRQSPNDPMVWLAVAAPRRAP